jgi:Sulfotransferase family
VRNCLILGSGRSGTSMLAGMLREVGYYIGDNHIPPREGNPKGFFEDSRINRLNERLVAQHAPRTCRPVVGTRTLLRGRPRDGMWAARLSQTINAIPEKLAPRVEELMGHQPFAYKDPRFCYTLPAWRRYLPADVGFVCIFREPARTANSMVKEVGVERGLGGLTLSYRRALKVWIAMYTAVLSECHTGDWLFVHYDQVLGGHIDPITEFLGVVPRKEFSDAALRRTPDTGKLTHEAQQMYTTLLKLAQS